VICNIEMTFKAGLTVYSWHKTFCLWTVMEFPQILPWNISRRGTNDWCDFNQIGLIHDNIVIVNCWCLFNYKSANLQGLFIFGTFHVPGSSSYGSWIYNYLCSQCPSPLKLWFWIPLIARCTTLCDKVCQWLVTWSVVFSWYSGFLNQ
jgi:hypothetical protein